ncbi:uncharacterized protein PV09_06784 [Verruconis gallopava]|uniref:OTU domain-containing protein n=1 Tax=Verruconis gallopava TaxID=253628 RepID=A0A0D1XI47_9PEZI|nr:uncharacterized protein PV09_06784 [Verruconis gallopava]KIW01946.1 hypothetical protein PV09_06784 [Verruconis gallopava]
MSDEFPLLPDLGLYAADIKGDGNCLFNALSDQIYGDQTRHLDIRARVIEFMREHADYYKGFLDVQPGGGTRRNPKRKNAGAYSSPSTYKAPTPEEIDRAFEQHIQRMAKGGTWGDNMEIVAFAAAFNTDVRIYMSDFTYMVPGQGDESSRGIAHIAYHEWEHYSSIRNIDGPHTGLPHVQWKKIDPEQESRLNQRAASHAKEKSYVEPWKIKIVMSSLPFLTDSQTIKHTLEKCRGNVNDAVSMLIEADEAGSISSTQESSSVERDYDSDDEQIWGPNKRANRSRLSRVARNLMKDSHRQRAEMAAKLARNDGSQESVSKAVADLEIPDSKDNSPAPFDEEDEWVPSSSDVPQDVSSAAQQGPARLKINVTNSKVGKTQVRNQGPRPRANMTARDRKEARKRQQKEDRKKRAQQDSKTASAGQDQLPILTKGDGATGSSTPSHVDGPMKTLYI